MENLLGLIASTISFVMWLPQARATWKHRNSPKELAGISLGTQFLVVVNATVWGIYAFITGAYWSGAPGAVNLPLALLTIVLIFRAKKMSKEAEALAGLTTCGCGETQEHLFFALSPFGQGEIRQCTGDRTGGFPIPVGTTFDQEARTLSFPVINTSQEVNTSQEAPSPVVRATAPATV